MSKTGQYELQGIDMYARYGWFSKERSSSDDLLKFAKAKDPEEHDWQDENGKEYDLDARLVEDSLITLTGYMEAPNEAEYWRRYYQLRAALLQPGELNLYSFEAGKNFKVFYKDNTKFRRLTRIKDVSYICVEMDFQLQLIADLSIHRPIYDFNTSLTPGVTAYDGTTLKSLAGMLFRYNSPFPAGDSLPASMTILIGGVQVAEVNFRMQAIGQPCSLEYNGTLYQLTFQNKDTKL
jgi:hypothetical protein